MFLTCMLIIINLNARYIKINIFYNGFYKHGREVVALVWTRPSGFKLHALKTIIQTPPYRPFDHEDLLWEVVIQHTWMQ